MGNSNNIYNSTYSNSMQPLRQRPHKNATIFDRIADWLHRRICANNSTYSSTHQLRDAELLSPFYNTFICIPKHELYNI